MGKSLPEAAWVTDVAADPGNAGWLYVGTSGGVVRVAREPGGTGTAVVAVPGGVGGGVVLRGAYPNPSNATTVISFTIPVRTGVDVAVYDALGQRVRVLAAEDLDAGQHTVVWDGTTDDGLWTGSGVYFYKLQAGGSTRTGRLVRLQ